MTDRPHPEAFDEASVLAEARAQAGLDDFGDEGFRTPLRVLLQGFAQAPVHDQGAANLRAGVVKSLVTRLGVQALRAAHPEIDEEVVRRPLVVLGMMRSGTTMAQRLLAADDRHHCVLGWEVGEPVPRPGTRWDAPDPRIADAEERDRLARAYLPELAAIHPSDAHEAEEEIMFFADAFLSHVHESSCDLPGYPAWLDQQDLAPAYAHLHRMLQVLQWQKRQRGEVRSSWVLKTPSHLGYLEQLFATFPDAHVVHLHREPRDTIPSGASLLWVLWRTNADDVDPALIGRRWLRRMSWANDRAMAAREAMAGQPERFTDVRFADLMADPLRQVQRVYDAVGLELTPRAHAAMQAWLEGHGREQLPAHRYTAEQFGLTGAQIDEAFAAYRARFLTAAPA